MGQYCFAGWRLSSSNVVCTAAGGPAGRRSTGRAWTVGAPAVRRVAVGRPTLHGGPVVLRPVRATPCFVLLYLCQPTASGKALCFQTVRCPSARSSALSQYLMNILSSLDETIDVKNVFYVFYFGHVFYVFLTYT